MKLMSLTIAGKHKRWSFSFYGDPSHMYDWLRDGLDVELVENVIPDWVPHWLIRPWCWDQDFVNFKFTRRD